jgi:hypothetical protein
MTGAIVGALLVIIFAGGPILAIGRVEGDERQPIRFRHGR